MLFKILHLRDKVLFSVLLILSICVLMSPIAPTLSAYAEEEQGGYGYDSGDGGDSSYNGYDSDDGSDGGGHYDDGGDSSYYSDGGREGLTEAMEISLQSGAGDNFLAPIGPVPGDVSAIHIKTPEELADIGGEQGLGKYYVLDNDINLTEEWVPIDNFCGTFDGRGFCVNNLFVLKSSRIGYAGLFGFIKNSANIKNVAIKISAEEVTAYSEYDADLDDSINPSVAGGLVAAFAGKNPYGSIDNCYVVGNVNSCCIEGYAYAGGLVGTIENCNVKNCHAEGGVSASSGNYIIIVGGLIGDSAYGDIENCYANGDVSASAIKSGGQLIDTNVGGLIGCSESNLKDCYASGDVFSSSASVYSLVGGLVGYYLMDYGRVINCHASGNVNVSTVSELVSFIPSVTESIAGGLIGASDAEGLTLKFCYAKGDVSASSSVPKTAMSQTRKTTAGGLIGDLLSGGIEECYATGDVYAENNGGDITAGGLIGYAEKAAIGNTYATGDVVSYPYNTHAYAYAKSSRVGGLLGDGGGKEIIIANSYATGDVSSPPIGPYSPNYVGGLTTNISSVFTNCFRLATQKVYGNNVDFFSTPLTDAQMKAQSSFVGWDFTTVWGFKTGLNNGYPVLRALDSVDPAITPPPAEMRISSSGITNGVINNEYGKHGSQFKTIDLGGPFSIPTRSLPITVNDPPAGTACYAIIMEDITTPWDHWLAANIDVGPIQANASIDKASGMLQGTNSFGTIGYGGPTPPDADHSYKITVYALSRKLSLTQGYNRAALVAAMYGNILKEASLIAKYPKDKPGSSSQGNNNTENGGSSGKSGGGGGGSGSGSGVTVDMQNPDPPLGAVTPPLSEITPTPSPKPARSRIAASDETLVIPGVNPRPRSFTDVPRSYWARLYIEELAKNLIIDGYPEESGAFSYKPDNSITRAEVIKLLVSSLQLDLDLDLDLDLMPDIENELNRELDIEPDRDLDIEPDRELAYGFDGSRFADWDEVEDWAKPYVGAAVKAGFVYGSLEDGLLYVNSNSNITRQEMVAMAIRVLNIDAGEPTLSGSDVDALSLEDIISDLDSADDWAKPTFTFAVYNGMINTNNGVSRPLADATRAETAMVLYKLLMYINR